MALPTASDNAFPSLLLTESSAPSSPAAGKRRLWVGTDHVLQWKDSSGNVNPVAALNKWNATTAPTVNEDSGDGYAVGSRWIDTTNDKEYVCLDATVGAAVWHQTDASALSNPMTTTGDMIYSSDGSGTPARKAIGSTGDLLTVAAGIPSWSSRAAVMGDLLPWTIDRAAAFGGVANTNWSTFVSAAGAANVLFNGALQSSGAQNAEVGWDEVLGAGTWDFVLFHYSESNRGIYTLRFDGVDKGTIDGYAGTPGSMFASGSVTGITVATTAKIRVTLKMATKNASSSSYYGTISGYQLRRTA